LIVELREDIPGVVIVHWAEGRRMAIVDVLPHWSAQELVGRLWQRYHNGPNGPRVDDEDADLNTETTR
jgi:hypothetical protein